MKTMRWVLIRPLNQSLFYDPETQEPLGLEYLASVLKELGCDVLILDSALDNLDNIKLARRAASFQPDVTGVSITTGQEIDSVMIIYNECKRISGNKPVHWVAGGNYVTCEYRNADETLPPEFRLVKFDGELFIRDICSLWSDGLMSTLPRLTEGEPVVAMDELPFPQRPYQYYLKHFGWAFNIQGSRGCCSACKYCASSGMRGHGRFSWRGRSPDNIVKELAYLHRTYTALTFNFVDEDFLGPPVHAPDRANRLSTAISDAGLNITFGIQVRPNSLSEEIIDTLASAGLKYVFMGIESDDPDDFKRWGRKYCADTWRFVRYLQEKEIEVNAGTLLFHPDCTFDGIRTFADKLRQHGLLNNRTATNRMDAMPGSFYYNQYITGRPGESFHGVIRLPFKNQEIDPFYRTVVRVFKPVDAPSMHALCSMPIAQTNRYFKKQDDSFHVLKNINLACDTVVSDCFFRLLDMFEKDAYSERIVREMVRDNVTFGRKIAGQLIENGFVESPEALYQTIQM